MKLQTEKETAEQNGLSEKTLANWRHRGEGPKFIKLGRRVMYDPKDIEEWRNSRRFSSTSQASVEAA